MISTFYHVVMSKMYIIVGIATLLFLSKLCRHLFSVFLREKDILLLIYVYLKSILLSYIAKSYLKRFLSFAVSHDGVNFVNRLHVKSRAVRNVNRSIYFPLM